MEKNGSAAEDDPGRREAGSVLENGFASNADSPIECSSSSTSPGYCLTDKQRTSSIKSGHSTIQFRLPGNLVMRWPWVERMILELSTPSGASV